MRRLAGLVGAASDEGQPVRALKGPNCLPAETAPVTALSPRESIVTVRRLAQAFVRLQQAKSGKAGAAAWFVGVSPAHRHIHARLHLGWPTMRAA